MLWIAAWVARLLALPPLASDMEVARLGARAHAIHAWTLVPGLLAAAAAWALHRQRVAAGNGLALGVGAWSAVTLLHGIATWGAGIGIVPVVGETAAPGSTTTGDALALVASALLVAAGAIAWRHLGWHVRHQPPTAQRLAGTALALVALTEMAPVWRLPAQAFAIQPLVPWAHNPVDPVWVAVGSTVALSVLAAWLWTTDRARAAATAGLGLSIVVIAMLVAGSIAASGTLFAVPAEGVSFGSGPPATAAPLSVRLTAWFVLRAAGAVALGAAAFRLLAQEREAAGRAA